MLVHDKRVVKQQASSAQSRTGIVLLHQNSEAELFEYETCMAWVFPSRELKLRE